MPYSLGISAFYHDSAAALMHDGEISAAAQEERFTRHKHDASFPISAINYCLEEAALDAREIDRIFFYEKPLRKFERIIDSLQAGKKDALTTWLKAAPGWRREKLHVEKIIVDSLELPDSKKIFYAPHHLSHAASAFYPSPFEQAAILTCDGVGEWATASIAMGKGQHVDIVKELHFPDSLGLIYSAFTHFCGFKVNSGEYKLMGLAPYGSPVYLDKIMDHIAHIREDGSIKTDLDYFAYVGGGSMTSDKFATLFDGPARKAESPICKREIDLAASIQAFTELVVQKMAVYACQITEQRNLCLAGGVALNCVANGKLLKSGLFDEIWVQPAAGDAGGALGAAMLGQYAALNVKRKVAKSKIDNMQGAHLGPKFSTAEVAAYLESYQIPHEKLTKASYGEKIATALASNKIVGFFQGRMEFGPRALGARSILGNATDPATQKQMNLRIKFRESFRPFAPSVLAEEAYEYFDLPSKSPYMLMVAPVREERRKKHKGDKATVIPDGDLLKAVNQVRSDIPAVTHWDYSARVQTVHKQTNPVFHDVLRSLKKLTGYGLVVNTSFNVRGEPIVCTPDDAYRCFLNTDMDFLFLEGFWIDKQKQPKLEEAERERWRNRFRLD